MLSVFLAPNGSGSPDSLPHHCRPEPCPDAGEVYVDGKSPGTGHPKSWSPSSPTTIHLYKWMTARRNHSLLCRGLPFFPGQADRRNPRISCAIQPQPSRQPSRGRPAKLALALSWETDLVLLDEPLAGIDPASREEKLPPAF